jgi:hypothetical protein
MTSHQPEPTSTRRKTRADDDDDDVDDDDVDDDDVDDDEKDNSKDTDTYRALKSLHQQTRSEREAMRVTTATAMSSKLSSGRT